MSRKYKKKYQIVQNDKVPSSSVQGQTPDEGGVFHAIKSLVLLCLLGPEKENPKPLTLRVCVRRFFIVLDNLIAAALLYYVLTWIKFYTTGADTSFDVIIDDMTILCMNNVLGLLLIFSVTWRFLYDSDSLPCLENFLYKDKYELCLMVILGYSVGYLVYWLRLFLASGFDIDTMFIPRENLSWAQQPINYLPYWAQEIRIVIIGIVCMVRRCCLKDTVDRSGRKLFEKKVPKVQTTDAPKTTESVSGEEPKEEGY